jgi:hypothetical protein
MTKYTGDEIMSEDPLETLLDPVTNRFLNRLAEYSVRTPIQVITFLIQTAYREQLAEISIAHNLRKGIVDPKDADLKKMLE